MEAAGKKQSLEGLAPLFRKYHVSRAFLFGSIRAGLCRKDSDIDLYVEGLDPEAYWDLWREIEQHSGQGRGSLLRQGRPAFGSKGPGEGRADL